jgi:hypothetical protein
MQDGRNIVNLEIFLAKMKEITYEENRPFSYKDFLSFDHNGITYKYRHGTIRNIFSILKNQGLIDIAFKSFITFYTLSGAKFNKPMTEPHGGATSDSLTFRQNELLHLLLTVPMDKPGIHDIRLHFKSNGLWSILPLFSDSRNLIQNIDLKSNEDVTLHDIDLGDFVIKLVVHKTDIVSVMIACTESPISIDLEGMAKLTSGLVRAEERLQNVINEYIRLNLRNSKLSATSLLCTDSIPNHLSWTVTMWHFGFDSLTEYSGQRFHISWGNALKVFRVYSKEFTNKKKIRIRKESQEYPNKPWTNAFAEKMKIIGDSGPNYYNMKFNQSLIGWLLP